MLLKNHKNFWQGSYSNPEPTAWESFCPKSTAVIYFWIKRVGNFGLKKKRPYWMNNFSCILHILRKIKRIFQGFSRRSWSCYGFWKNSFLEFLPKFAKTLKLSVETAKKTVKFWNKMKLLLLQMKFFLISKTSINSFNRCIHPTKSGDFLNKPGTAQNSATC